MSPRPAATVWVPTPPGWVEVAAFDTDERAHAHWRDMVEPVREELGADHTEELYRMLGAARSAVAAGGVSSAGVVLTVVEGEMEVWTFATTVETVRTGPVNPAALVERALARAAERTEDVTLPDGRVGVLARLTTAPGEAGTAQHHCVVAVPLAGRPHDVAVVAGSTADAADTDLLAMAAVSMAAGVEVGTGAPGTDGRLEGVVGTVARLAAPGGRG